MFGSGSNEYRKISPRFISDGKKRYKLSSFMSKKLNEVKLTNDERRYLLTIFSPKERIRNGVMLLAAAFCTFFMGIVFCAVAKVIESAWGTIVCLLPSIILLTTGIYMISAAPNIEKSVIKAYEFTVENMKHIYLVRSTKYDTYYRIEDITSISVKEADRYGLGGTVRGERRYCLYLNFDGKWLELLNTESYAPVRQGIRVGDKIRCAVLECGKYCYISLY